MQIYSICFLEGHYFLDIQYVVSSLILNDNMVGNAITSFRYFILISR